MENTKINNTYSIIIQCYNGEEELQNLLKTIPDQERIEILIIDDHSSSPISISKYHNKASCKVLRNEKNSGYGYNRHRGILNASNSYLIFMDSNNIFLSDSFDLYDQYIVESDAVISAAIEMSNGRNQDKINCLNGSCFSKELFYIPEIESISKCSYFEDTILCAYLISNAKKCIFRNGIWSEPGDRHRSSKKLKHPWTYDYLEYLMMSYMFQPYMNKEMKQEAIHKILDNPIYTKYNFEENYYLKIYYMSLFDPAISINKQLYYMLLKNFFYNICQGEHYRILSTIDEYLKCVLQL